MKFTDYICTNLYKNCHAFGKLPIREDLSKHTIDMLQKKLKLVKNVKKYLFANPKVSRLNSIFTIPLALTVASRIHLVNSSLAESTSTVLASILTFHFYVSRS